MTIFLDAHALLWALYLPERLSDTARQLILNPQTARLVSEATQWELLSKVGRGKVAFSGSSVPAVAQRIRELQVTFIPILQADTLASAMLPHHHSDPFDRILIAQAVRLSHPILTADTMFHHYPVKTIW